MPVFDHWALTLPAGTVEVLGLSDAGRQAARGSHGVAKCRRHGEMIVLIPSAK